MTHLQYFFSDLSIFALTEFVYPMFCLLDFLITKNLYFLSFTHLVVEFAEGFGMAILISGLVLSSFTLTSVVLRFSQNNKGTTFKFINPYNLLCTHLFKNL